MKPLAILAILALGVWTCASGTVRADPVADFYKGKTLTITVAGGAGSTMGLYCRLLAAHWGRHVAGQPNVVCQFRPGAGGTTAASYMHNAAPKDGTVVGQILSASVLVPVLRKVNFDAREFQWVGSASPKPAIIALWHTAPAKSVSDSMRVETIVGSTGKGSETYLIPTLMNSLLGTKFKIIMGYSNGTADINLAMETGEVHGRWGSWAAWASVNPEWLASNKIVPIVQYGPRIPELPNVPYLKDLMKTDEQKKMIDFIETSQNVGMGYFLPPGAPRERLQALRTSFDGMMKDAAFLDSAKKANAEIAPISGPDLQALCERSLTLPTETLQALRKALGLTGDSG